ncbi:alpha/beta hydrolase [Pseudalkalibacillus sp. SCS-8]|uniref:alpha/beta fold hydrolase n=1 Tax=Pseudalkalibacillus nanhaiensis TaxID=3115291 RepID=UPI0032DA8EAF
MRNWKAHIVHTDRGQFEVFTKGEGNPVCVTHLYSEFNETGDHFADTFTRHNQTILINLRGTGKSTGYQSRNELSMSETVKDLDSIREGLEIESWTYAGHSTGGMLGLRYAIDFPDSLNHLIVVGSAASGDYASDMDSIYNDAHPRHQRMQSLIAKLKMKNLHPDERKLISRERIKLSLNEPEKYETYFSADVFKKISTDRLDYYSENEFPYFDYKSELSNIELPVLIICGENDVQCPIRCSEELHGLLMNSTFLRFQHSNHYPFLEEKDRFQFAVRSFLS